MADEDPNLKLGAEIDTKLNFYVLGLTFGVLALSVQTASFAGPLAARIAELSAWVLLLLSGLMGLSRLEWMPTAYQLNWVKDCNKYRVDELKKRNAYERTQYQVDSIDTPIKKAEDDLKKSTIKLDKINRTSIIKYRFQKYMLLLGLVGRS